MESGGDGMGGFVLVILGAMVGMVGIAIAVSMGIGLLITRLGGLQKRAKVAVIAGFAAIGLLAGYAWMASTFMESSWDPPHELAIALPPGLAEPFVVLIVDPERGVPVTWSGGDLPTTVRRASVSMPATGILRVRNLEEGETRGSIMPVFSDGSSSSSSGSGPVPPGFGGTEYLMFSRDVAGTPPVDLPIGAELVAHVRKRETPTSTRQIERP
jgi:hypothetical protein